MDQSEHYYQLVLLGRDAFMRQSAPAVLVRRRSGGTDSHVLPEAVEGDTMVASMDGALAAAVASSGNLQVFPLAKKQGAPFAEMITVGRTSNNDVVIEDVTVSRFHAFFKQKGARWSVADSGSKNGTKLGGQRLEARKEQSIDSGDRIVMGDVETVFYTANDLFAILSGTS